MKPTKLFALIAIVCASGFFSKSYAQVDLTINPIGVLWGDFNVGADFAISENFSIEGAVGYQSAKSGSFKYTGIPVISRGKYYFNPNRGADKFYADAFLKFVNRDYKVDDNSTDYANYTATRFGIGFGVGYKAVSAKGFVFDLNFGVGRAIASNVKYDDSNGTQFEEDWINLMFDGKLAIGYRFGGGKK